VGRLAGKVALVTGAGSGIGRASAQRFAAEGARVVLAELRPELGKAAEQEVQAAGGQALFVETDVTQDGAVERAVRAALERFGALHVLFNCAGGSIPEDGPVSEVPLHVWDHTISLDLKGTLLCCRHAIPGIARSGGGSVINTSSVVALRGSYPMHVYSAAKGAVLSLTRSLAGHYARDGIRVNAICPGVVLTERVRARVRVGQTGGFGGSGAGQESFDPGRHPFSVGYPEDIANIALFLASDEARMITGATIPADGGLSAY
jgi:NAD(P)-dependent dehydrogenase (short-subunit alcohol dehydrogenase family)